MISLQEQRAATRENVERKMARTADELLEDQQEEEEEEEEVVSEPDDDEVPYNPKNLPLGWDGKVCVCERYSSTGDLVLFLSIHVCVYSPFPIGCTSCMA